jgi:hypothetical protein
LPNLKTVCQIEYVSGDSDTGTPCGKTAIARCADCGSAICLDCRLECCGDSFCEPCYDYHTMNFCVRKPVQNESQRTTPFRSAPYKAMVKQKESDDSLKGWPAIAKFLSQPVSTAQRWASEGLPVTRIGRYVADSPAELERWLTREAGTKETVHIAYPKHADLKRGLSQARKIRPRKSRS